MKDAAAAKLLAIKVKEKEGKLLDAERIASDWASHCEAAKNLFLALPVELRLRIPKLSSDDVALIEDRIIAILDALTKWTPGDLNAGG